MGLKIAVIGARGLPASYSGVETHCEGLYLGLIEKGYEVILYSRENYSAYKNYKGIKIKSIRMISIKGFDTFICSLISTIQATFSDADIIHFHAQGPAIFSWIPRLLAPKKIIGFTCHGIDWQRDKWGFLAKLTIKLGEVASARFPHFKIAVSQYLVDYYDKKYNVKLKRIFNGIEIQPSLPLTTTKAKYNLNENEYFLFVARLVPEKAVETLIKAIKTLKTDKKLVLVGDSSNTDDYVAYLKSLAENDERIIFTSYVYGDELNELYSNAYAYISASKLEGLPITLLEAMSFARPVILSDIGPHVETLECDNSAGKLFEVNDLSGCAKAMESMLKLSDIELEKMGLAAKNIVLKHFQWQNVIEQTDKLYREYFSGSMDAIIIQDKVGEKSN